MRCLTLLTLCGWTVHFIMARLKSDWMDSNSKKLIFRFIFKIIISIKKLNSDFQKHISLCCQVTNFWSTCVIVIHPLNSHRMGNKKVNLSCFAYPLTTMWPLYCRYLLLSGSKVWCHMFYLKCSEGQNVLKLQKFIMSVNCVPRPFQIIGAR